MQVREKLDQVRKLAQDIRKLLKRREKLLTIGASTEEIDAEIKLKQADYLALKDCLVPLINLLYWDQQRAILYRFYLRAEPISVIVSEVMKLPVESSCISLTQSRKQMALRDLQKAVDREEGKDTITNINK